MEHKNYIGAITINWGQHNSVLVGLVSFENDILKDIVYDEDRFNNVQMYLRSEGVRMDLKEQIYPLISGVGFITRDVWEHYSIANATGIIRWKNLNPCALTIDKAQLQTLLEIYSN